jgi:hypothetical protein
LNSTLFKDAFRLRSEGRKLVGAGPAGILRFSLRNCDETPLQPDWGMSKGMRGCEDVEYAYKQIY